MQQYLRELKSLSGKSIAYSQTWKHNNSLVGSRATFCGHNTSAEKPQSIIKNYKLPYYSLEFE